MSQTLIKNALSLAYANVSNMNKRNQFISECTRVLSCGSIILVGFDYMTNPNELVLNLEFRMDNMQNNVYYACMYIDRRSYPFSLPSVQFVNNNHNFYVDDSCYSKDGYITPVVFGGDYRLSSMLEKIYDNLKKYAPIEVNISVCQIRSLSSEQILTSYNFFGIDNMTNSLNQHRFCQHLIQLIKFDSRYYTIIINTILLQPNLVSTALDQVFTFQLNNQLHNLIQEDEQLKETLEIYNRSNIIVLDYSNTTDYSVGRVLGAGGFSICYQMYVNKAVYCAKAITNDQLNTSQTLRELLAGMVCNHTNVIKTYCLFSRFGVYHILMEMADENLTSYISRVGQIPIMNRWKFAFELVNGLIHLHEHKIIHGDIKTDNMMIVNDVLKIGDLGFCKPVRDWQSRQTKCCTAPYAPFEQIKASSDYQWSFPADVYSASLLIGYLVTGHHYNARILQLYHQNKSGSQVCDFMEKNKGNFLDFPPTIGLVQTELEGLRIPPDTYLSIVNEVLKRSLCFEAQDRLTAVQLKEELIKVYENSFGVRVPNNLVNSE